VSINTIAFEYKPFANVISAKVAITIAIVASKFEDCPKNLIL
jgi:hypothetical protein